MGKDNKNYSRIIKSSSMIGGAQGVNILIGMIRVKFIAILIGPLGIGLFATYQSIIQVAGTISGLGLQSSAVRDISKAASEGNEELVGKTVLSLIRMCWFSGVFGCIVVALLSPLLSNVTFGNSDYISDISILGLAILFANLKGGQMAIIQGMRRINDLAKLNIIGVLLGSIISIVLYWFFGMEGIVPAIITLTFIELLVTWFYAKKIIINKVSMTWLESFRTAGGMIRLGLAFMWTGLLIALVAYLTRTMIAQQIDLVSVGVFSAAFSLSGIIVNFILKAMGADYYPALTAISNNNVKMGELVNQQTEIGILLAMPGLLGTFILAPWVIEFFYSSEFYKSIDLLRWFALGCFGRVVSWPLGYIILAKGMSKTFAFTETVINIIHISLVIVFMNQFGLVGVSIAYPCLYFIYIVVMLIMAKYIIDFNWSRNVWILLTLSLPMILISSFCIVALDGYYSFSSGLILLLVTTCYCFLNLVSRLDEKHKLYKICRQLSFVDVFLKKFGNK